MKQPEPSKPAAKSARDRLISAAAKAFRTKGYDGTGLSEILSEAGVPKGSLYHHFPDGKADLAAATARYTGAAMERLIDASFVDAKDWRAGVEAFAQRIGDIFEQSGGTEGCPVTAILLDGDRNQTLRNLASEIFDTWITTSAQHLAAHGIEKDGHDPQATAEAILITLEGCWILARARQDADLLRQLPERLWGPRR